VPKTAPLDVSVKLGKNIDNVLESVANATVRNHRSDNGRASDVIITGLDSFTLTSNGAVFGTDNIIHSTAIANTWIIGATDSEVLSIELIQSVCADPAEALL
jgi:hypothetical protein